MSQSQLTPSQIQQILKTAKPIICKQCAGQFFKQVFLLNHVSKVVIAAPEDVNIPIPIWRCDDCGTPVMEKHEPEVAKNEPKIIAE